jgi:hypothetical protein
MSLFPSALRSDRLTATGTAVRPLHRLWTLVSGMIAARRSAIAIRRSATAPVLALVSSPGGATIVERAEPTLRWDDPHHAPAGDFTASAIPNAELDITAVPGRGESWDAVSDFALSYDGYAYWDDLSTLAGRVLQRWTRRRSLPDTLDELRGCLFYEQRRWNHFGEEPTGRSAEYMWATVEAIGALVAPVTPTVEPNPDPRRAVAPEAHVKLVANRAVALRPVPSAPLAMGPLSAPPARLTPVRAAEAHVRLVTAIEGDAGMTARHPAGHAVRRTSSHLSGNPAEHAAMSRSGRDLRPMPSADPLPKPPVIVRRARRAGFAGPNRPGGALKTARATSDPRASNGSRGKSGRDIDDSWVSAPVTPLCHEFFTDDAGYGTWMDAHPEGYVLNQPRSARSKAPTLHRVGCAVVARRPEAVTLPDATDAVPTVRVCGPNVDALRTWSMARGTGSPAPCRRCCP